MTANASNERCDDVRAALARGGAGVDWAQVEQHLASCVACGAGLTRFAEAVGGQFAASDALYGLDEG